MIQAAIPPNIASNSKGSIPSIVVPEAIATGTILDFVASIIASSRGVPFSSSIPAACIMGGLLVASLLTIFVLPVTYSLLFRVKVTDTPEVRMNEE